MELAHVFHMDKPVLESGEELLALFSEETSQVMMRDDAFTVKNRVRRVGYSHNDFFQQSVFKQSVRFCLCFSFFILTVNVSIWGEACFPSSVSQPISFSLVSTWLQLFICLSLHLRCIVALV